MLSHGMLWLEAMQGSVCCDAQDAGKRENGASAGNFNVRHDVDFACPLTGLPMNGRYRFVALRRTGHVISEKALKEVRVFVLFRDFLQRTLVYARSMMPLHLMMPDYHQAAGKLPVLVVIPECRFGRRCPRLWRRWWAANGSRMMCCH
jgi:hypothetical protein